MKSIVKLDQLEATRKRIIPESLVQEWIEYLDVKETTSRTYMQALKKFTLYCAERGISRVRREDVIGYREELKKTLRAGTAQLYLVAVKIFIRWMSTKGLMLNVSDHVKAVRVSSDHKRDVLTVEQSDRVLKNLDAKTLKGSRDRAMISLMLTCGLRRIEVSRLKFSDIETRGGRYYLSVHGKGRDDKELVQLPSETITFLLGYLQQRGKFRREDPLFISVSRRNYGGAMNVDSISRVCKEAFRAVGIDSSRITCHSCRHTWATRALLNGEDITKVSMVLRHRSIATTMIYRHDVDRATNHAEEVVARVTLKHLLSSEETSRSEKKLAEILRQTE